MIFVQNQLVLSLARYLKTRIKKLLMSLLKKWIKIESPDLEFETGMIKILLLRRIEEIEKW